MALIMQRAIDIDNTNSATQEEQINALLLENRGLKEVLAVHEKMHQRNHSSMTMSEVDFYFIVFFYFNFAHISLYFSTT